MNVLKRAVTSLLRHEVVKLDGLYQRHAGQECYIFGNGVTLKWMDLRAFTDRISIVTAELTYHKDTRLLNAPYCAITEPFGFYPVFYKPGLGTLGMVRNHLHEEILRSIAEHPETLYFVNISNYPVVRYPNVRFVTRWYTPPFDARNPFKDRADAHRGTLSFQLSLAIFLGFERAHLVGHDYTHFPSRVRHFYEKGEGELDGAKESNRCVIEYAKQHMDLVTVTLDGESRSMNHVTYQTLTGREPRYRENSELLEPVTMRCLATWPDSLIY